MSQTISLRELERKAWRSMFQDGMWEICLGMQLVALAAGAWVADSGMSDSLSSVAFYGLAATGFLILWAGKKYVTAPRIGRVKFGEKRKRRLSRIAAILTLSLVLGVAMSLIPLLLQKSGFDIWSFFPVVWVIFCMTLFGTGAYLLDFNRLYLIGVLYALMLPADQLLRYLTGNDLTYLAFGLPGLLATAMGLIVLVRFMRQYSVLDTSGETANDVRQ